MHMYTNEQQMIARSPAQRAEAVMSRAAKDCAMTEQDAVAADELKRFCQQLIIHGQFKMVRRLKVGSCVEIKSNSLHLA